MTADPAIRHAINIAVDRQALIDGVLEGHGLQLILRLMDFHGGIRKLFLKMGIWKVQKHY